MQLEDDGDGDGCDCDCGSGCDACEREDERIRELAAARVRAAYGGLHPLAHELFGPGWLGEGGEDMAQTIEQLAQRTLGDVFEQLSKVAELGREKCHGASRYMREGEIPPVSRAEVRALLDYVEAVLPYAVAQLPYLPGPRHRLNDRVIVYSDEGAAPATIVGTTAAGLARLRMDDGRVAEVHESALDGAAQ